MCCYCRVINFDELFQRKMLSMVSGLLGLKMIPVTDLNAHVSGCLEHAPWTDASHWLICSDRFRAKHLTLTFIVPVWNSWLSVCMSHLYFFVFVFKCKAGIHFHSNERNWRSSMPLGRWKEEGWSSTNILLLLILEDLYIFVYSRIPAYNRFSKCC